MTFPIRIAPLVRSKIEGSFTGEAGEAIPFEFNLTFERLADQADIDALNAAIAKRLEEGSTTPLTDVLVPKVRGWDLKDADGGDDVPFREIDVRDVLSRPGMSQLAFTALIRDSGAKAKNS